MDGEPSFGAWLRRRRKALDLTQAALARQAGCAPESLRKIEADVLRPSRQLAELLAAALEVAPGERAAFVRFAREGETVPADIPLPPVPQAAMLGRSASCAPVVSREAEPATPASHEVSRPRHNLPALLSSFIGREKEIAQLRHWLTPDGGENAERRLVTLTGVGGTGKSRLALEVARACLPGYTHGAWLAELAPLADPGLVPDVVAAVLNVPRDPSRPALKAMTDYLRAKTLLLVLDNCEHVLGACASLAEHLLCECPQLCILATSREALGVPGETALSVPSLGVPEAESHDLAVLMNCEAVQLFVDRAGAVRPEFEVTETNAPHVVQICRQLDGIPLAIELAAACVRALSVGQIAVRLDDRFRLLTRGSRTALPRHQTLRATMDWSYDLLAERERTLLARFSVFAGGWTLEAAEVVGGDPDAVPTADVLDGLARLVDKSLVIAEDQGSDTRYRMLETVRQYARDRLRDSGEVEAVRGQHLDYFLQFALAAEAEFHGPGELAAMQRLDRDVDNVRAALQWSLGPGRAGKGLRLIAALPAFWEQMRGDVREGREWAVRLLEQPEAATRNLARAGALLPAGVFSDGETGRTYLEEAVSIARDQGEVGRRLLAQGLGHLGFKIGLSDPGRGEALTSEAVVLARALGDAWLLANSLSIQGRLYSITGNHSAARQACEEGLALCVANGDQHQAAWFHAGLADVSSWLGDYAAAIQQAERCLQIFRTVNDRRGIASMSGWVLCGLERLVGRYDVAKAYGLEALEIWRHLGISDPGVLYNLGFIELHEGDLGVAKRLFAEAIAAEREPGSETSIAFFAMSYGAVLALEKKPWRAVALMAFSHTCFETVNRGRLSPQDVADYEHYLALARGQLEEAEFEAAWAEGSAMTLEQALALIEQETDAPRERG